MASHMTTKNVNFCHSLTLWIFLFLLVTINMYCFYFVDPGPFYVCKSPLIYTVYFVGPGPAKYYLPTTLGTKSVDNTKRHSPSFTFGSRYFCEYQPFDFALNWTLFIITQKLISTQRDITDIENWFNFY